MNQFTKSSLKFIFFFDKIDFMGVLIRTNYMQILYLGSSFLTNKCWIIHSNIRSN